MELARTALVVDDDPDIRYLISEVLERAGFQTVGVGNGADAVHAVVAYRPDVVTTDVDMHGIDGFETIRRIREFSDTRIVVISGLEEETDVVLGYGVGADAYVIKPFRPRELRAIVDRLMVRIPIERSSARSMPAQPGTHRDAPRLPPAASGIAWGGIRVDPSTWTASVDGRALRLTRTEFAILEALVRNAPNVLTYDGMASAIDVAAGGATSDSTRYRTHVGNLRQKLEDDSREPRWIDTVRGVGYRLVASRASQAVVPDRSSD